MCVICSTIHVEGSESSGSGVSSEEEEAVVVEWVPSGPQRALGDWEKHTTVSFHLKFQKYRLKFTVCDRVLGQN